jgi:plastocyanin domain-containing protein
MAVSLGLQPSGDVVVIQALNYGYAPDVVIVPAGKPLQLQVVTNSTYGCTRAFTIPQLNIHDILPDSGVTSFALPAQVAGTTLVYTCAMGMYSGLIQFGS